MNTKIFFKFTEDAILRMARVNGDAERETLLYVVEIVRKGQEHNLLYVF